jgi:hypothetical protein
VQLVQLVLEYLGYFAVGFTRHLTLLSVLLLTGAIVCARLGSAFGIDRLFWHERRYLQFRAGMSVGLLFSKVGFVGYLLDEERLRSSEHFTRYAPVERPLAAALYIGLLTIPVGCMWLLMGLASYRAAKAGSDVRRAPFVLGAGSGLLLSFGVLAVFAHYMPGSVVLPHWLVRLLLLDHVPSSARPLHLLAAAFIVLLSTEYVIYSRDVRGFTPAMAICTLLGLVTGVTSFLEFHRWNPSGIAIGVVLLLLLGGLPRYKLRLRALAEHYEAPVPLDRYMGRGQPPVPELLHCEHMAWRDAHGRKKPLVLVCASGGGLRSALWTADVLSQLELSLPGFAESLRIVAGASGGMVGASYYALTLVPPAESRDGFAHSLTREELIANLGRDSLSAPIKRLVFRDLPFAFLPLHNSTDRGHALEECWAANFGESFKQSFGDLFDREKLGELPSLVFTPMLVEDGRRLVISNLDLSFLTSNEIESFDSTRLLSRSGFEFARLFPESFRALPVRTAARLSAAFPYVSPAVSLPTEPRRRVVDAGYYDNYGVNVCAGWLEDSFCHPARRRWIEQNVSRILVVQIRDFVSPLQGASVPHTVPAGALQRGLEGLLSPLHGVLSSRDSVSIFRNDEQLEQVVRLYGTADSLGPGFVRTEIFEYRGEASLSWYLTKCERDTISTSARALSTNLQELEQWWRSERPIKEEHVGLHVANAPGRLRRTGR